MKMLCKISRTFSLLENILIGFLENQNLYGAGARKIGVTSVPPLGCLPEVITLFGHHEKGCVTRINSDAQSFNKKLNAAAASILKQHSDLKLVIFDIFKPLYDVIKSPSQYGTLKNLLHFPGSKGYKLRIL